MSSVKDIHISDYNYLLPDNRIAKYPLPERDSSKLLVWRKGKIEESVFKNITDFIPENSLLVFNNTKVVQARLEFFKTEGGARIEIFCLSPVDPSDYAQSFASKASCRWECLVGNAKRWKNGTLRRQIDGTNSALSAEIVEKHGETATVEFSWDRHSELSFAEILERTGDMPLPPYLNRKAEENDKTTYQTVYSRIEGSVAAPTAGLHFTNSTFDALKKKNIKCEELTLHVGAGTFRPVKSETLEGHRMHSEWFSVSKSTLENLIRYQGSIVAVGTTSVRTLESLWQLGFYLLNNDCKDPNHLTVSQWQAYETDTRCSVNTLATVINFMNHHNLETITASTEMMIVPGYRFRVVDAMITNFHQPASTLLLLVSAFTNGKWKEIYNYALKNNFRFLSYGDSSILINN